MGIRWQNRNGQQKSKKNEVTCKSVWICRQLTHHFITLMIVTDV